MKLIRETATEKKISLLAAARLATGERGQKLPRNYHRFHAPQRKSLKRFCDVISGLRRLRTVRSLATRASCGG